MHVVVGVAHDADDTDVRYEVQGRPRQRRQEEEAGATGWGHRSQALWVWTLPGTNSERACHL